ncbi:putative endo-1,3(4)-beta-glucanase [Tricharina praecox]|uniref:putative endo-1,3(4)-beta-glucanase n=1 Tax=Tricharina praecox TaxID=43433 RepID=UPI00221EA4EF|nr:putative endo-1,3(4)-beta-glucanase [Tricharina praecox]XP_051339587.1 putative endo-1,3(4)-beta-glucanase [Tricharina praecox]KAI5841229.1 putative endo-1,3(4)-beta-glucanase [Tricharina praecox]KAI5852097.1 putative endo-1,3(4)-beta-glucanase [Tricharina praecox]
MKFLLLPILAAAAVVAEQYTTLVLDANPNNFFDHFDFRTDEPTSGHVQYQTRPDAEKMGLIQQRPDQGYVYMGVDHWARAPDGRPSVRVESKMLFTHGLFLLDVDHMPYGCGVWPAFWTYGLTSPWPELGEIDIIENVHNARNNSQTIHVSPGDCSCQFVPAAHDQMTGWTKTPYCTLQKSAQYLMTFDPREESYGRPGWKGGVYAMEWTDKRVRTWFFPRDDVPCDVNQGTPNPETWGTPVLSVDTQCGMNKMKDHTVVINTTFCGMWAGKKEIWEQESGCGHLADTCEDYVTDNPEAFGEAYWKIRSVKVWKK